MTTFASLLDDATAWVAADHANDRLIHLSDQTEIDALAELEASRTRIVRAATAISAVTRDDLRDKARICSALLRTAVAGDTDLLDTDRALLASLLTDVIR